MDRAPTPITIFNLREWLRRTAEVDDAERARGGITTPSSSRPSRETPSLARPLFVLGAPRSGTSLLGDLIGQLPEFSYHYEPPITKAAARYVYEGRWSPWFAARFYRWVYRRLMRRVAETRHRFAEKTPQNCFVVPFLASTFPDASFVHIVRDGRDAALSYVRKPWLTEAGRKSGQRETGGYPFGPFARFWVEAERRSEFESTTDLDRCLWAWRRHVEAALDAARSVPRDRWLEVRYEDLAREPAKVGARVLDFLGVTADSSRSRLLDALRRVKPDSVGRYQRELDAAAQSTVEKQAGALLRRLGYVAAESAT
jgi:Sulfotransferase family